MSDHQILQIVTGVTVTLSVTVADGVLHIHSNHHHKVVVGTTVGTTVSLTVGVVVSVSTVVVQLSMSVATSSNVVSLSFFNKPLAFLIASSNH
ncbi:MAG: hypothetical protein U0L26_12110 [Cellulosilyticum sp.]|nr:hypothetical protein [Cellulosilyticum sp.]